MVETVGIRQVMWFVMLKFAKYRVLEVDTRTIGATTCPVWNDLLTNYGCYEKCALLE
jgi:hypothetical protein